MTGLLAKQMWVSPPDSSSQPASPHGHGQGGQARPGRSQTPRELVSSQPLQVPGPKPSCDERSTSLYHSRSRSEGCMGNLERDEAEARDSDPTTSGRSFQRTFSGYSTDPLTSAAECRKYLKTVIGGDGALLQVSDKVVAFHRSYVIVPGYHKHTSQKVAEWVKECRDSVHRAWNTVLTTTGAATTVPKVFPAQQVGLAIESLIMAGIHSKVFASLVAWGARQDAELCQVASSIKSGAVVAARHSGGLRVSLDERALQDCGVPTGLWKVNVSEAASQISQLEECQCPLEMMQCLLAANEAIVEAVRDSVDDPRGGQVSGDELLPLFLSAVVIAQPLHLASTLEYLLCFHPEGDHHGRGGYQLAVLEATVNWLLQCQHKGMVSRGQQGFPDLPQLQQPLSFSPATQQDTLALEIADISIGSSLSGPGVTGAHLLSGLLHDASQPGQAVESPRALSPTVASPAEARAAAKLGSLCDEQAEKSDLINQLEVLRQQRFTKSVGSLGSLTEWRKPPTAPLPTLGRSSCDISCAAYPSLLEGTGSLSGSRALGDMRSSNGRLCSSLDWSESYSSIRSKPPPAANCGALGGVEGSSTQPAEDRAAGSGQGTSEADGLPLTSSKSPLGHLRARETTRSSITRPPAVIASAGGGSRPRVGLGSFLSNLKQSRGGPSSGHTGL